MGCMHLYLPSKRSGSPALEGCPAAVTLETSHCPHETAGAAVPLRLESALGSMCTAPAM